MPGFKAPREKIANSLLWGQYYRLQIQMLCNLAQREPQGLQAHL